MDALVAAVLGADGAVLGAAAWFGRGFGRGLIARRRAPRLEAAFAADGRFPRTVAFTAPAHAPAAPPEAQPQSAQAAAAAAAALAALPALPATVRPGAAPTIRIPSAAIDALIGRAPQPVALAASAGATSTPLPLSAGPSAPLPLPPARDALALLPMPISTPTPAEPDASAARQPANLQLQLLPAALRVTLAFGRDLVAADFSGMRPLPATPGVSTPFHWTASPDEVPAAAVAPVCLGAGEDGCLFVDLALAPGVVTVTGDPRIRAELGAELANRLGAAIRAGARRCAVVVAGAPFHDDLLVTDPIRLASPADFDEEALPETVDVCFLVCRLTSAADGDLMNALAKSTRRRIVPIVVDDVVASDWSLFGKPAPVAAPDAA
jgi:hypothetical protein